ncbi:hypothetical protein GPECTOR_57g525 [Gonium pectorale]|uniref:CRAL-TRIO domain-containing protein n=1 Tax=Gonium pectorale TaxID=33097 RepID=A0A150G6S2_GONPE|nr:hypothetical protein GPECTOR_57g525 [Gonium pectorale]|eukprot:KXZ45235.1 hypothetical protein GPECTOR_57g525 [Gonium pectorale]
MWKLLGKLLLMGAARRWAKRPTAAVETAALVLVLNEHRLGHGPKRDMLWGLVQIPEVAPEYGAWVGCLRNVLAAQGLRSLPPGFDPDGLELTRYLLYGGMLAAGKPAEAMRAVAATAAKVTGSLAWRAEYPFLGEGELQELRDVAWWVGPDPDGTLWLHLHLARAVGRCVAGQGRDVGRAVVSALEYGTRVLMCRPPAELAEAASADGESDDGSGGDGGGGGGGARFVVPSPSVAAGATAAAGRAGGRGGCRRGSGGGGGGGGTAELGRVDDRIRVVIVGTGSNVRQALRLFPCFREFTRLVQRHYPGRLRAMYLVDMPRGLRMGLGAILNLLSQETRQKVKLCKAEDLPDCIATALAAQEAAIQQMQQQQEQQNPRGWGRSSQASRGGGGVLPADADPDADDAAAEADSLGSGAYGAGGGGLPAADASGAGGRLLLALTSLWVAAMAALQPAPAPPLAGGGPGLRRMGPVVAAAQQLLELRLWLLRVLPAVLMAAMACLTYKSLLARP